MLQNTKKRLSASLFSFIELIPRDRKKAPGSCPAYGSLFFAGIFCAHTGKRRSESLDLLRTRLFEFLLTNDETLYPFVRRHLIVGVVDDLFEKFLHLFIIQISDLFLNRLPVRDDMSRDDEFSVRLRNALYDNFADILTLAQIIFHLFREDVLSILLFLPGRYFCRFLSR